MTSRLSDIPYIFRTRALACTAWACVLFVLLIAGCTAAQSDVPALEKRSQGLNKTIMCPICPGESIDQSQATIALQMRDIVQQKIAIGWTDDQIRDFFVERYGPSVLMEPPTEGFSLLAWIVPPVIVFTAIAAFLLAIRRMRGNGRRQQHEGSYDAGQHADLERYYDRIEAALGPRLTAASSSGGANSGDADKPVPGELERERRDD